MIRRHAWGISLLFLVMLVGLVWLVIGEPSAVTDSVVIGNINTSSNALIVRSSNGIFTNGTTSSPSDDRYLNLSRTIEINISLIANGTTQNFHNVSFTFILTVPEIAGDLGTSGVLPYTSGTIVANITTFNYTRNQTAWNITRLATQLEDGYYNISVAVLANMTNLSGTGTTFKVINLSRLTNILIDNMPPHVVSIGFNHTNNSNITSNRKITFNATLNDTIYTQQVIFGFFNNFANGTQFNVTAKRNNSVYYNVTFSTEIDTSVMTDGTYTVSLYANDSLNNRNLTCGTCSNMTFVLDRTGPNVTIFLGNYSNYVNFSAVTAATTGNFLLNISVFVNDSVSPPLVRGIGVDTTAVLVNVTIYNTSEGAAGIINSTSAKLNGSFWNAAILSNGSSIIIPGPTGIAHNESYAINISDSRYFPDGLYYIRVFANDSLGNINNTQNLTFRIDRTNPTVTVTCGGPYTAGQTVTCTCTRSDGGSGLVAGHGFSGQGDAGTRTTTASGTTGTSEGCSATDYAGNTRRVTGSWTVTAAASGGGGGTGGSGGGSSSGVSGQFERNVWTSINAGETATVSVDNGEIAVTEVSFSVGDTTYGAWVQVAKVDSLPSDVSAFSGDVYRRIRITHQNVEGVLTGKALIKFKVEKSWLAEQQLEKGQVALFRYADDRWNELSTVVGEDDGTYVHYTAESPGFSYFVIAEKGTVPPALGEAGEEAVPSAGEEAAGEAAPGEGAAGEAAKGRLWPVVLAIVVIVIIVVAVLVAKKRKA